MSTTFSSKYRAAGEFWCSRREASLNWLALGLLLAAWNASDNIGSDNNASVNNASVNDDAATTRRRPEALRSYSYVTVRAANRATAQR
jgi:hypothetical protein